MTAVDGAQGMDQIGLVAPGRTRCRQPGQIPIGTGAFGLDQPVDGVPGALRCPDLVFPAIRIHVFKPRHKDYPANAPRASIFAYEGMSACVNTRCSAP
jgi:hypothetical protein